MGIDLDKTGRQRRRAKATCGSSENWGATRKCKLIIVVHMPGVGDKTEGNMGGGGNAQCHRSAAAVALQKRVLLF